MLPGWFSLGSSALKSAAKLLPIVALAALFAPSQVAAWGQVTAPAPYDFGAVPAGASSTHTLTFSFTGAATVGSVSVVTQGLAGKDFQPQANDPSSTLCAGRSFASGDTCTVDVTFGPLGPGHRIGEVQLLDGSGAPLATSYISGWGQGAVLVSGPQLVSTVAGIDNTPGYNYDPVSNTTATNNQLNAPRGVVTDLNGNIYIADASNNVIRQVTPAGIISTVAGVVGQNPGKCLPLVNAPALTTPAFSLPGGGMAIDASGNLIVGDYGLHCVYSVNIQAETITTLMGQAGPEFADDSDSDVPGPASQVEPREIGGVGVDGAGNIYVGTAAGHVLRIDPSLYVTVVAGTFTPGTYHGEGGPATSATLSNPYSFVFDAAGELIFTDYTNGRVLRIDSAGNIHTVLGGGSVATASLPLSGSSSSVPATSVQAGFLWGVAIDGPGNLYATTTQYGQIIEVDPNGHAYLFAGTAAGTPFGITNSDSGDGGSPSAATFSAPSGFWIAPSGDMFVADEFAGDVRRIGYTPLSQTSLTFAATDIGHKSADSPQSATLTNIGNAPLTLSTPASGTNPRISPSFTVDPASTCPKPSTAPTGGLALDASCTYDVDFIPLTSGPINGSLDILGNLFGGIASIQLYGTGLKVVDTLVVTAPPTAVAGTPITVNVVAYYQGSVATGFTGPLTITSTDGKAILPAPVTLTAGVGSFSATLETTGIQTITATDASGVTGTSNNILVTAGSPYQVLPVSGSPQHTFIGTDFPNPLKVEVLDQYGNSVGGATVTFSAPASGASATFSPATCSTSTTAPIGYCSVVATANGTASAVAYTASASVSGVASPATFSLTNLQARTTLAVTPSATSLVYGQPVAIAAAISPSSAGGSVPTGFITFYDGAGTLSPNLAVSSAAATYSVAVPTVGNHDYSAQYLGDANFFASPRTWAPLVVVHKAPVAITGPAGAIQVPYGSSTTVPLTVAGPYTGPGILAPTGNLAYRLMRSTTIVASGALTISASAATVPVANTLAPGTYSVLALYTPGDANYAAGSGYASVATVEVGKITPAVAFTSPGSTMVYGTALNVAAVATWKSNPVPGVMTYTATPAGGSPTTVNAATVLSVGSYTLTANFAPTDTATYNSASATMSLTVTQATPILFWATPAAITYGTALSATQLDATATGVGGASLAGTFVYTPAAGTKPDAGTVTLSVQFTPNDSTDYTSATRQVSLTVNQASQVINFTPLTTPITYGAITSMTLAATGGASGNPVTFTVTGPATLNGSTLAITGAGAITVTANQAGNANYSAAAPVQQTVVVNKAAQVINFKPLSTPITYGSVTSIALAATGGASGNPVTFTLSGPATLNGSALSITGAGAITVTANQAGNANYNAAAQVQQILVVNKATVTLTGPGAQPLVLGYNQGGSIAVTITGQYSGAGIAAPGGVLSYTILNSGNISVGSGTPSIISGGASIPLATTLAPGSYMVDVAYPGDANYLPTPKPTVIALQVGQIQPLIHWATPAPIVYGTKLTGVLNATALDGANTVSGSYAYSTGATAITASTVLPAGSYPLTVNFTPADANVYKTASGSVTLVVNKAMPGVSISSSANPILLKNPTSLTATVSSPVSTPGGTVTFLDGTTPLGTETLVNGVASLTLSSLATGAHSITATYSGDANFVAMSSTPLPQHVDDFGVAASGSTTSTIWPGANATFQFTLTPVGDTTFPSNIALSLDGQPTDATITITPSSVNSGAGTTNFSVTVNTPSLTGAVRPANSLGKSAAPLALALLLLPFSRRMRRQARKLGRFGPMLLLVIAMGAALLSTTGCGAKTGFFAHPPQTYTLTVTGASGPLSHSASVTLTVE